MESATLNWTVNPSRATVSFGRLVPFAGNTYDLEISGVENAAAVTAYVLDSTGLKCLAKSSYSETDLRHTIAFNTADLREEFVRDMHEIKTFHVILRDDKRVIAEGDLSIQWQSLWEDMVTGEVYSMRGPQGLPGKHGEKGEPGGKGEKGEPGLSAFEVAVKNGFEGTETMWLRSLKGTYGFVKCEEDGKYYRIKCVESLEGGGKVLAISQTPEEYTPLTSAEKVVSVNKIQPDEKGNITLPLDFLPLTGGTLRGFVQFDNDAYIHKSDDSGYLGLSGGENYHGGGVLVLRGKNSTEGVKGEAIIVATNDNNQKVLYVRPDGTLKWDSKHIVRSVNGYNAGTDGNVTIPLPYLPLSGGTLTGVIKFTQDDAYISKANNTSELVIAGGNGWDNGGAIVLRGKSQDHVSAGEICLKAQNETDLCRLILSPGGSLTWGGKNVLCVETYQSGDSWYRKYSDGWIEQGGVTEQKNYQSTKEENLITPFANTNYTISVTPYIEDGGTTSGGKGDPCIVKKTTTTFKVDEPGDSKIAYSWYACGY